MQPVGTASTTNPSWQSLMRGIAVPKGIKVTTNPDHLILQFKWSDVFSWLWFVFCRELLTLGIIGWYASGQLSQPSSYLVMPGMYIVIGYQMTKVFLL
jgi:hypothetical protein